MLDGLVQKLGYDGKPINGVIFEVCLYDGEYTTPEACPTEKLMKTWYLKSGGRNDNDGKIKFDDKHLADEYKASSSFYYDKDGKIVIPKGCTITYQEKVAPAIYEKDETVQIWTKENSTVKMKKFYNKRKPSTIKIKKLDENGNKPLQDVEFELTFKKQTEKSADDSDTTRYLLQEGKSTTAKTDANGEIIWKNLAQGEYQITEIHTVSGYSLLSKPINITVPISMTDAEVKAGGVDTSKGEFDDGYTNKWYFYEVSFEVTNTPTFKMPTTGSNGFWKYGFFGFGMITILGAGLITCDLKNRKQRKRKRK